jgi:hypothetical protein
MLVHDPRRTAAGGALLAQGPYWDLGRQVRPKNLFAKSYPVHSEGLSCEDLNLNRVPPLESCRNHRRNDGWARITSISALPPKEDRRPHGAQGPWLNCVNRSLTLSGLQYPNRLFASRFASARCRHTRELLPILIRAIARQSFCPITCDGQIKDWFLAAAMKNPRVDQKALRRYRKIMAAFSLADPRRLIMPVKVPTDLTAEMLDDEISATRATVRLLQAETKSARVTRESGELISQCISLFTFWTGGHPAVVAIGAHPVNT